MRVLDWERTQIAVPAAAGVPALRLEARRMAGPRAAAVVAPPHPLYGGTFDNPVVLNIAEGLFRAGVGPLTFNWRGTEASEGQRTDSLAAAVADYTAALASLPVDQPLLAAGYSFGAGAALLAAGQQQQPAQLRGLILLAPPLGLVHADDLLAVRAPILVIAGSDDAYAPIDQLEAVCAARTDLSLVVIPGADHFFHYGGLTAIGAAVREHAERWLAS
jgi:alpha/beta superfamily hydrolase